MEEPTHISEMGIHIHPGYNWDLSCVDRTEGPMNPSAHDSLLESSHTARLEGSLTAGPTQSLRKPTQSERRVLESGGEGIRQPLRRVS
jgi:hypothetical protein